VRKAAVNAPQSRRFAKFGEARQSRQRLDCGGFSTALPTENVDILVFSPHSIFDSFKT
jgi:hypothetical protein